MRYSHGTLQVMSAVVQAEEAARIIDIVKQVPFDEDSDTGKVENEAVPTLTVSFQVLCGEWRPNWV